MEIKASEFKARCLKLMDEVAHTREPIIITKNGKPVAQLGPVESPGARSLFGLHPGGRVSGDIVSPAVPVEEWDVHR